MKAGVDKSFVPREIHGEWFRSDAVLAWQEEINLLLREREIRKKLSQRILKQSFFSAEPFEAFRKSLYAPGNDEESRLIAGIQKAIIKQNSIMLQKLEVSKRNLENLEIDIMQKTKNILEGKSLEEKKESKDSFFKKLTQPFYRQTVWGVLDVNDSGDSSEIWADEKWAMRVVVKNACPKKP